MVHCHLSKRIIIIGPTATLLFPSSGCVCVCVCGGGGGGGGVGYTHN